MILTKEAIVCIETCLLTSYPRVLYVLEHAVNKFDDVILY